MGISLSPRRQCQPNRDAKEWFEQAVQPVLRTLAMRRLLPSIQLERLSLGRRPWCLLLLRVPRGQHKQFDNPYPRELAPHDALSSPKGIPSQRRNFRVDVQARRLVALIRVPKA